ncbi:Glycosyltransferase, catalytic subunit of cellulose synthase and poly-beta-1,6-N-acetylglucosamine synthase [Catalinimonas alkaloidigena]|uniref:Glycosyltransferase, catalytic subunit of cellulose synthase and poly-beta-1,6-N-acetylglucosamine synthase n=1 Tax=Catalinimonas alkaloidigena TaxID=1075417 RepID=A0A1G9H3N7_9BACT|nr:glycosyltransferase family 2 protein [Catalinimonas alkaloidigena]SDL07499.1 Glycosyltransferase, catalytic subunit of cellulose synthase and poly-beta-1,6-N-acetylglucosamine synthase [Catalinimonas alkaloidigena]
MLTLHYIFWISVFIIVYTYLGYGLVAYGMVRLKRLRLGKKTVSPAAELPDVTLVVPAYNEMSCLAEKLENSFQLDYPKGKLHFLFVAEGSTDGTQEYLRSIPEIEVVSGSTRRGKIEAINQAMQRVKTPLVVFSDTNTSLNPDAIRNLVRHYEDPSVGGVAGEKRVQASAEDNAAGAGEGLYWKYESFLKRIDSELQTVVGAAGELFSMRTHLYQPVESDTILDDFIISLRLTGQGYQVVYEPEAYALEKPSFSVAEEMKRKIRISAGGFQSIRRLSHLLNPFRYGLLTFQYVSHRVLRWAVVPFCLIVALVTNFLLAPAVPLYQVLLVAQLAFYTCALVGYLLEQKRLRIKLLFVPFYFSFMNWCVMLGLVRYMKGQQSGIWEKARRAA